MFLVFTIDFYNNAAFYMIFKKHIFKIKKITKFKISILISQLLNQSFLFVFVCHIFNVYFVQELFAFVRTQSKDALGKFLNVFVAAICTHFRKKNLNFD